VDGEDLAEPAAPDVAERLPGDGVDRPGELVEDREAGGEPGGALLAGAVLQFAEVGAAAGPPCPLVGDPQRPGGRGARVDGRRERPAGDDRVRDPLAVMDDRPPAGVADDVRGVPGVVGLLGGREPWPLVRVGLDGRGTAGMPALGLPSSRFSAMACRAALRFEPTCLWSVGLSRRSIHFCALL
jgi:hypothetical protein